MISTLGYPIETRLNDANVYSHFNSDFVLSNFAASIKNKKISSVRKVLPFYIAILGILISQSKVVLANDDLIPFSEHSDHFVEEMTDKNSWYPSPMEQYTEQCPASSWTHFPVPSKNPILTEEPIQGFSDEMLNAMPTTEKNLLLGELIKKLIKNDRLLRKCLKEFKVSRGSVARFSISQILIFGCYCYGRRYLTLKYQLSVSDWEGVKRNSQKLKKLILRKKTFNNSSLNGRIAMIGTSTGIASLTKLELSLCLLTSLTPFQIFITGVSANAAAGAIGSAVGEIVGDIIAEDGTQGSLFSYVEKWVGGGVRSCYQGTLYAVAKVAPFTNRHIRQNFQSHRKWPYAMDNMFENNTLPIVLHNLSYNQTALTGSKILNSTCKEFLSPKLDATKSIKSTSARAWKQFERDQGLSQAMVSLQEAIVRPNVLGNTVLKAFARANKMRRQDSKRYEKFINCLGNYLIRYVDANDTNFEQFICSIMPQIVEASQRGLLTKSSAREFIRMILKHVKHEDAKLIDVANLEATLDLCKNGFRI